MTSITMRQSLNHIISEDHEMRIRQILGFEHIAIAVEYGDLSRGYWSTYQGITIRDDAIEGLEI